MMLRKHCAALFLLLTGLLPPSAPGEERAWTSVEGNSITASLLGTSEGRALMKTAGDGLLHWVLLERLTPGDRERIMNGGAPVLPAIDLRRLPADEDIEALLRWGADGSWSALALLLRHEMLSGYSPELPPTFEPWFFLYRWVDLFRENGFHTGPRPDGRPFGHDWPEPLRASVLGDAEFSREFFRLIAPEDDMALVSTILAQLHDRNPDDFEAYKSLALAIAVVYDQPPPARWPVGGQVPGNIFPPGLPDPVDAFDFFVSGHKGGRLLIDPRRLTARELRFAVDIVAPLEELHWARQRIRFTLGRFAETYSMIEYDRGRNSPGLREVQLRWPHADYRLETILRLGGICVDQAYFSSQVGKARGVPTVYFSGAGENGSHAWVGYHQGPGRGWDHGIGRYEQGNYVVGRARDPQTWKPVTDHEIAFFDERFHRTAEYRASRLHSDLAREFRMVGDTSHALGAARRAIDMEPRNRDAWEIAISIQKQSGQTAAYESALKMASGAFRHFPQFEADYLGRLVESLVRRNEMEEASALIREISRKNRRERPDISLAHSKKFLAMARDSGEGDQLVQAYRRVLSDLGDHTPGTIFFQEVTRPFLTHLHRNGEKTQARVLYNRTRQQLRPPRGSLLDREMERFEERLR